MSSVSLGAEAIIAEDLEKTDYRKLRKAGFNI